MLLKQIQYFLAVTECHHFTRAAERLFISQSALSQQITKLENDLGVKLLNRESHPVSLTPAGEDFYHYAQTIMADVNKLYDGMEKWQAPHKQSLHIGIITGLGNFPLSQLLTAFHGNYPEVDFALEMHLSKELCHMLQEDLLDFAILALPQNAQQYELATIPIRQEPFLAVLPANHPLAKAKVFDLRQASEEKYIFPTQKNVSHDLIMAACKDAGFQPSIVSYCSSATSRIDLVEAGLGISLVSESAIHYHKKGAAVVRPLKQPFYKHTVIARHKGKSFSLPKESFWDYVKEHFALHPAQ